jgi:hypothetical protein
LEEKRGQESNSNVSYAVYNYGSFVYCACRR